MVPSQPSPSSALRANCWVARNSPRSCSDVTVPVGESDGRLSCLPLEICSCSFWPLAMLRLRSPSMRCRMLLSVTLLGIVMRSPYDAAARSSADEAGAVDQLIEHRVDRGQHPGRGLVTPLEGQQIGH